MYNFFFLVSQIKHIIKGEPKYKKYNLNQKALREIPHHVTVGTNAKLRQKMQH